LVNLRIIERLRNIDKLPGVEFVLKQEARKANSKFIRKECLLVEIQAPRVSTQLEFVCTTVRLRDRPKVPAGCPTGTQFCHVRVCWRRETPDLM
jgi:hypothetical protein